MPGNDGKVKGTDPAEVVIENAVNENISADSAVCDKDFVEDVSDENASAESSDVAESGAEAVVADGEKIDYENASLDDVMQNVENRLTLPDTDKKARTKKEHGKKWIAAILLIAFNAVALAVVLYLELNNDADGFLHVEELFKVLGAHGEWLALILIAFLAHLAVDSLIYFVLIKQCGYGNRYGLSLRTSIIGFYYNNLTPWSTGGQPFQMAYLAKSNLDTPTACTLPFVKHTMHVYALIAFVAVMFGIWHENISWVVQLGAYLAVVATALLPLVMLIFSKKLGWTFKITEKVVALGAKLKLVKNYDKAVGKARDTMDSLAAAYKYLSENRTTIIVLVILSLADLMILGLYPYLIVRALGGEADLFETVSKSYYVSLSSGIIPTPGASGASEASFYAVFDGLTPEGTLFWAVLLYRMLVFYLPIIMGVILHIAEALVGKRRVKRVTLVKREVAWYRRKTINNKLD